MAKLSFYTVQHAAQVFKRTPRTIRRWVMEGTIREVCYVRDGILIPEHEIQRIVKAGLRQVRG